MAVFSAAPMWLQYCGILIAVFVVAAASYHLVERPARRAIIAGWVSMAGRAQISRIPTR
jgi:peptidoglycan/LPS O-acetylase OafA/YrhL